MERAAIIAVQCPELRLAEPRRVRQYGMEDRFKFARAMSLR